MSTTHHGIDVAADGSGRASPAWAGRSALPAALTLRVEVLEQLVRRKLDLLMPRLRGRYEQAISPIRWIRRKFERSFQRILDARDNRRHHRTTGLMLSQELVRQVRNALTEPWNKGVVARNRVVCTERPRSHVFRQNCSQEFLAGYLPAYRVEFRGQPGRSCGPWWRSLC